jgi:UDP-3-O-[3-hydroxymyristoyl] glucosamine N-acyltransferase
LGKGCIIVSQVGISGSTHLGDFVVVGGQTGIAGHLTIASGTRIAAQSGVMRSVEKAMDIGGAPAMPSREWHRQTLAIKNLAKSDFMNHNDGNDDRN